MRQAVRDSIRYSGLGVHHLRIVAAILCATVFCGTGPASAQPSPARFVDNGDGTISDHETLLMWEKKDDSGGLHDKDNTYAWACVMLTPIGPPCNSAPDDRINCYCQRDSDAATCTAQVGDVTGCRFCIGGIQNFCLNYVTGDGDTAWRFIRYLNNRCANDETLDCTINGDVDCAAVGGKCGFAGYRDWRLPEVNVDGGGGELDSLVDLTQDATPLTFPAFNVDPEACTAGCVATDSNCSCTLWTDPLLSIPEFEVALYLSAVTQSSSPPRVWAMNFNSGEVESVDKTLAAVDHGTLVRAVRDARFQDNGDGTIDDPITELQWEKKDDSGGLHDKDDLLSWACYEGGDRACANGTCYCQPTQLAAAACAAQAGPAAGCRQCAEPFTCPAMTAWQWVGELNNRCENDETLDCTRNGNAACAAVGGRCGFAGYRDWRLPEVDEEGASFELDSLISSTRHAAPVTFSQLNVDADACDSECVAADSNCSCTLATSPYLSSVTQADSPARVWAVSFESGEVVVNGKLDLRPVRAVHKIPVCSGRYRFNILGPGGVAATPGDFAELEGFEYTWTGPGFRESGVATVSNAGWAFIDAEFGPRCGTATLEVSKPGFRTVVQQVDLDVGVGGDSPVRILTFTVPLDEPPVITSFKAQYRGLFLEGIDIDNTFMANVDWGPSGVGTLNLYVGDEPEPRFSGDASQWTLNMGDFSVDRPQNIRVRVEAVGPAPNRLRSTNSPEILLPVVPVPPALVPLVETFFIEESASDVHIGFDTDYGLDDLLDDPPMTFIPITGFPCTSPLKLCGFGLAGDVDGVPQPIGIDASFDYTLRDGSFEFVIGKSLSDDDLPMKRDTRRNPSGAGREGKFSLLAVDSFEFEVTGGINGFATLANGLRFEEAFVDVDLMLEFTLGTIGPLGALPQPARNFINRFKLLRDFLRAIEIAITLEPEFSGEFDIDLNPRTILKSVELNGDAGLYARYRPGGKAFSLNLWVGGVPGITVGVPTPPPFFREFRFEIVAGAEVKILVFQLGPSEAVLFRLRCGANSPCTAGRLVAQQPRPGLSAEVPVRPMSRDYLDAGLPRFVANLPRGNTQRGSTSLPTTSFQNLLLNVFPEGAPAMAANGDQLTLLHVADNGIADPMQRTDINWMFYDGSTWSDSQPIVPDDAQADFEPQVVFDGNGDALAVWSRVRNANAAMDSIESMAAELEIFYARWNHESRQWSAPTPITDNEFLDHDPRLTNVLDDGSIVLTWVENQANLLVGEETGDPLTHDHVRWAKWDGGSQSFGPIGTLASDLVDVTSTTQAGIGTTAIRAWSRETDGNSETDTDQEIFYSLWTGAGWSDPARLTEDAVADRDVHASVSTAGDITLVWRRGTDLVFDENLQGTPAMVRPDSNSLAFSDFVLTEGPNRNLALVWTENAPSGVDAFYMVYDRNAGLWSEDLRLTADSEVERSLAPVWDGAGNLTIAYIREETLLVSRMVAIEGSDEEVMVDGLPTSGQADLALVRHSLGVDLGVAAADLSLNLDEAPDDGVAVDAIVRNLGDLAANGVEVAFYDGDPNAGGIEIAPRVELGTLAGGASAKASATLVIPEVERESFYVVVDPGDRVGEVDEDNNLASIAIGGTDLSIELENELVGRDGSADLSVLVTNLGSPASDATDISIRRNDGVGPRRATTAIPSLAPGETRSFSLSLPPGSIDGSAIYLLTVAAAEPTCPGDCDGDGNVRLDELVVGLNIALARSDISTCAAIDANGDGAAPINEVIGAVGSALNGCVLDLPLRSSVNDVNPYNNNVAVMLQVPGAPSP